MEYTLTIAIFVGKLIPFVEEFFDKFVNLNFPKNKINLFIFNNQKYNQIMVIILLLKLLFQNLHLDFKICITS